MYGLTIIYIYRLYSTKYIDFVVYVQHYITGQIKNEFIVPALLNPL